MAKLDLKISRKDLGKLFQFATSQTNFLINGNLYDQVDGVAMGLPFSTYSSQYFHGISWNEWIRSYNYGVLLYFKRYVDDLYAVFESKDHAVSFYNCIDRKHSNIKFTKLKKMVNSLF